MATINVKDAAGSTVALEKPLTPGAALAAASRPVTLATDDALVTATGAIADAAVTAGATGSVSAKLRSLSRDIGSLVTAWGSTLLDFGVGTGGSRTQRVTVDTAQLAALATTAQAMSAGFQLTDVPTDGTNATRMGALTETAPATDTASSGLNGRLQRVAQRITSLIALFPAALGGSGGLKVDDIFSTYKTVAASQTATVLGATGATGDYLAGVLVIPATSAAGLVTVLDNATSIPIFVGGGTTALADCKPFMVPIGAVSVSGAWKITTGANVSVIAIGKFT